MTDTMERLQCHIELLFLCLLFFFCSSRSTIQYCSLVYFGNGFCQICQCHFQVRSTSHLLCWWPTTWKSEVQLPFECPAHKSLLPRLALAPTRSSHRTRRCSRALTVLSWAYTSYTRAHQRVYQFMINTNLIDDNPWKGVKVLKRVFFFKLLWTQLYFVYWWLLKKNLIFKLAKNGNDMRGPSPPPGLLDEMVNEAWQATLSFWDNERWRKFVYSNSAKMKMSDLGHGFFMIGSTWCTWCTFVLAKQVYQTAEWSAVALMVHKRLEGPTQNKIFSKTIGPQHIATGFFRIS